MVLDEDQQEPLTSSMSQEVFPSLLEVLERPYIEAVSFLKDRVEKGIERYGTVLKTHNGRDAIVDSAQEASDLLFYLEQLRLEAKDAKDIELEKNCSELVRTGTEMFLKILQLRRRQVEIDSSQRSPHYTKGRKKKVDTIIIHHTETRSAKAAVKWFCDTSSKVSAHYVIDTDGKIYRCVDESDTAWHCGVSSLPNSPKEPDGTVNHRSIGIELANLGDGKMEYPVAQMESLRNLVLEIRNRYGIGKDMIFGHREIAPNRKTDPSDNFDWSYIR